MKMVVTVVSGLLIGLTLASSNLSPIQEIKNFLLHKRRIFASFGVAVTGYILVLSGVLVGLIEGALQWDAQGFMMWSAMFSVATGLALFGICSILISRLMMPALTAPKESILSELNKQFKFNELAESMVAHFAETKAERSENADVGGPPPEEKFAESPPVSNLKYKQENFYQ